MANSPQARKRIRQNEKQRLHNKQQKSRCSTAVKKTVQAIENNLLDEAKQLFKECTSLLDRLAGKNIIKKNTAARKKSRIARKIKKLEQAG